MASPFQDALNPWRSGGEEDGMRKIYDDERLMARAGDMYYNRDMPLSEIAAELGISRPTLKKLLTRAREIGVIKIIIPDLNGRDYYDREYELKRKYRLRDVIITDSADELNLQREICGRAAAAYLDRIIKNGCIVGFGMGVTMNAMLRFLNPASKLKDVTFLPLLGGMSDSAPEIHSNHIVASAARRYGGKCLSFCAPARVDRLQTKLELMREAGVSSILNTAKRMDIAMTSLGAAGEDYNRVRRIYYDSPEIRRHALECGICGDMLLQCYDAQGDTDAFEYNKFVVGVELRQFRQVPCSIGIAGGAHKADSVRGAIAGGYLNVLITDIRCAELLL